MSTSSQTPETSLAAPQTMSAEKYAEKRERYTKSKLRKTRKIWCDSADRLRTLEAKVAKAKEQERKLWDEVKRIEAENPDDVVLSREIFAESDRLIAVARAAYAASRAVAA